MKSVILDFILQADKKLNNQIDFVSAVYKFMKRELEQLDFSIATYKECMSYASELD